MKQSGIPIRSFDMIAKVRHLLALKSQILMAIYGIDMKANKVRAKKFGHEASVIKSLISGQFQDAEVEGGDTALMRDRALITVKTFKVIKTVIWETSNTFDDRTGK